MKAKPNGVSQNRPASVLFEDDELRAALAEAEQSVAAVERKLAECAEEMAAALSAVPPDEGRVAAATQKRAKFSRERETALERVAKVEADVASAAKRRAARRWMNERLEEYNALCDKIAAGNKILQSALDEDRRARKAIATLWEKEKHPAGADAHTLRKEIQLAAEAAGVPAPPLPEPRRFEENFRELGNDLAAWANPGDHVVMGLKEFEKHAVVAFERAVATT